MADAGLTWRSARGGIRVTSVRVDGPAGLRRRDRLHPQALRPQSDVIRNPKLKGVFAQAGREGRPGGEVERRPKFKPLARKTAPQVTDGDQERFRGRTVPNGGAARWSSSSRRTDQIGQAFFWDVSRNAAGAKTHPVRRA